MEWRRTGFRARHGFQPQLSTSHLYDHRQRVHPWAAFPGSRKTGTKAERLALQQESPVILLHSFPNPALPQFLLTGFSAPSALSCGIHVKCLRLPSHWASWGQGPRICFSNFQVGGIQETFIENVWTISIHHWVSCFSWLLSTKMCVDHEPVSVPSELEV